MNKVNDTLEERGEVYGDYRGGSEFRARTIALIKQRHFYVHGNEMDPIKEVMIYDIVNKLSRLAVTPDHKDSWHDLQGYAKLIEDTLGEENE